VSQKERIALPAKRLYRSALFQGRRSYAEAAARPWFIISARYGLVDPDQVTEGVRDAGVPQLVGT
jgi:hypothetical protein